MAELLQTVREGEGIARVRFREASILDTVVIQQLSDEIGALVEAPENQTVILDFAQVKFLSSHALGVLLVLRRRARQAQTRIVLEGVQPELSRIFHVTNLDSVFEIRGNSDASSTPATTN